MAEFYICAPELEFEKINSFLNIAEYKIRSKDSFPIKEFAKDYWSIDTGYEQSEDINIQIKKIYSKIRFKVDKINKLKDLFCAEVGFVVTVKQQAEFLPAIYFENEFIKFAAAIGADINMDFC
jgi:hypothetical protein